MEESNVKLIYSVVRRLKIKIKFAARLTKLTKLAKFASKLVNIRLIRERKLYLFLLCLAFITHNSSKLFFQRNKVVMETDLKDDEKLPTLTGCIQINATLYNDCPASNFEKCEKLRSLFSKIQTGTLNVPKQILDEFDKLDLRDLILIRGPGYAYNTTFLNYNHVCVSYSCENCKSRNSTQNLKLINTYRIAYTLFIHEERYPIYFRSSITKQNCKIFSSCSSNHIFVEKYEFELLQRPYQTDCIDYTIEYKNKFYGYELVNSKEGCLNICLKEKYRNTFFFYSPREDGKIEYRADFASPNASEEQEFRDWVKRCYRNCSQANCYASKYFLRSSNDLPDPNYLTFELEPKFVNLRGRPYIRVFELWLNIISFVCLVLGVDFLLLATIGFNHLAKLLRGRLRSIRFYLPIKRSIFVTKWSLIMFLFSASLYQAGTMAETYLENRTKTHYRIKYPSEIEPFSLHICLPLTQIIKSSPFRNATGGLEISDLPIYNNESFWKEKLWLDNYLKNKRLLNLVEDTFNLTEAIDDIYFEFGLKRIPVQLNDDLSATFFKVHFMRGGWNKVMKCFTVQIGLDNLNYYENLFVSARLYIKFKQVAGALFYITPPERNLSSEDALIYSRREVVKREIKFRTECLKDDDSKGCKSKLRCLDACVLNWVLNKYKEIHLNLLHLGDYEKFSNYSIHLNYALKAENVSDCIAEYSLKDCESVKFDTEKTHFQFTGDLRFKILQIVFRTIYQIEVDQRRVVDFVLNLLNVYSVLFGITCQNLMVLLFKLLELKFEITTFKKYSRYALKLVFSICCLVVIQFIVKNTFQGELRTSLLIMPSPYLTNFPEINVCFDLNHLVRGDFTKLTGHDLERISQEINYDNLIEKIIILGKANHEDTIRPPFDKNKHVFSISLRLDEPYFFLNKKCLRIAYNFSWIKEDWTNFKYPITIKLNQKMKFSYYYYCSNLPGSLTLSQLNRLSYRDAYEVFLDQIRYNSNDEYEELKNPQLFFKSIEYKNPDKYLAQLTSEIVNRTGVTTLWFPLHRPYFGLTIDNRLFESHYAKFKAENDRFSSLNFDFEFLKERIILLDDQSNISLRFNRETLLTKSFMETEESFLSFLVNILNSFCFFFSISTFNVVDFFYRVLIKFICRIQKWFQ